LRRHAGGFFPPSGAPDYISNIRPGRYRHVLRNLHWAAIALNGPIVLLCWALLPSSTIYGGVNILSALAQVAGRRWMRIWIVADACLCLCAGVLTGIISACALLDSKWLQIALCRIEEY
jgi:hypothetical protein